MPEPTPEPLEPLTRREREVLSLLADSSLSNADIAARLTLAHTSIKWYERQIYAKLSVNNRRAAVARARELGWIEGPGPAPDMPVSGNLPAPLSPFIGRSHEIDQVSRLLAGPTARLVTLTGVGGVGKTRLGIRVAEELLQHYPHGCWLVELSAVMDGRLVPETTAGVFGLLGKHDRDPLAALLDFLRDKKLLLILDNCEHLLEACAGFLETLLRACPRVQVLATGRAALGIPGEIIYPVPALVIPDPHQHHGLDQFMEIEAVRLFTDRAAATRPGFTVTTETIPAIARICQKLDGIPLALELAAARLRFLDPQGIAERLDEDYRILSGSRRSGPPHQQTLQASLDWSYNLLSPAERALMRRLAVFGGGWSLEMAGQVWGGAGELLELLSQLIDKSLVLAAFDSGTGSRASRVIAFWNPSSSMPGKNWWRPGRGLYRSRHLACFMTLAETAETHLRGQDQAAWFDHLEQEIENIRRALHWALVSDPLAGLRLASALLWFWHIRGRWLEGLDWLERGLRVVPPFLNVATSTGEEAREEPQNINMIRAKALAAAGFLQSSLLDYQEDNHEFEKAAALFQESLAILQRCGFRGEAGWRLFCSTWRAPLRVT